MKFGFTVVIDDQSIEIVLKEIKDLVIKFILLVVLLYLALTLNEMRSYGNQNTEYNILKN